MKKQGAFLLFGHTVGLAILTFFVLWFGLSGFYMLFNLFRAAEVKDQADQLDRSLFQYAVYHKGIRDGTLSFNDEQFRLNYRPARDYPLKVEDFGEITDKDGSQTFSGFFDAKIRFCKSSDSAEDHPYKFKYTPLDEHGNTVSVGSTKVIAYYTLEVYYKNALGELTRYVSPRSYENIKDLPNRI